MSGVSLINSLSNMINFQSEPQENEHTFLGCGSKLMEVGTVALGLGSLLGGVVSAAKCLEKCSIVTSDLAYNFAAKIYSNDASPLFSYPASYHLSEALGRGATALVCFTAAGIAFHAMEYFGNAKNQKEPEQGSLDEVNSQQNTNVSLPEPILTIGPDVLSMGSLVLGMFPAVECLSSYTKAVSGIAYDFAAKILSSKSHVSPLFSKYVFDNVSVAVDKGAVALGFFTVSATAFLAMAYFGKAKNQKELEQEPLELKPKATAMEILGDTSKNVASMITTCSIFNLLGSAITNYCSAAGDYFSNQCHSVVFFDGMRVDTSSCQQELIAGNKHLLAGAMLLSLALPFFAKKALEQKQDQQAQG